MPNNAIITFTFAGLSADYCFTSFDRFALDIAAGLQGYLPGAYSTIIRSESEPVANDRDKVWVQVNADGAMTGRIFTYAYGKWVMQNPRRDPAERVWFEGSESDAWSYDGGDGTDPVANPPTATTGAMWTVDHNYDFRFTLGAGTSPKPTTVTVGATGGEEDHQLILSEIPPHVHDIIGNPTDPGADLPVQVVIDNDILSIRNTKQTESAGGNTDNPPVANAHNNMPPYRAGYWLKPTARIFWTP